VVTDGGSRVYSRSLFIINSTSLGAPPQVADEIEVNVFVWMEDPQFVLVNPRSESLYFIEDSGDKPKVDVAKPQQGGGVLTSKYASMLEEIRDLKIRYRVREFKLEVDWLEGYVYGIVVNSR